MGTWGPQVCDSDDAMEFWEELQEVAPDKRVQMIVQTIDLCHQLSYVDFTMGYHTLAGCLLALVHCDPGVIELYPGLGDIHSDELTLLVREDVHAWGQVDTRLLLAKAQECVTKITRSAESSEAYELWEGNAEWLAACKQLRESIGAVDQLK